MSHDDTYLKKKTQIIVAIATWSHTHHANKIITDGVLSRQIKYQI